VSAGGGDVVHRARLGGRDPQREAVRGEHGLDVAAMAVRLAGVPQVDDLAFYADSWFFAPVTGDDLPVQDHMRKALVFGPFQRFAQVRSLFGEYGDHFVHIPVGGGPRDAVVTGRRVRGGAVAEPAHPQHSLPKAGQRPAAARGAAPPPLGEQQRRDELHQFPGDVKRGTIGDHVEPSSEGDLVVRPSSTGAPRPCSASPVPPRVCPDVPVYPDKA